jgi:cytochrome c nitrite reductase small subunit
MQDHYDSWQQSSHRHVAVCNDCHLPHNAVGKLVTKADNGFFHSLAFTLENFHEPIQIKPRMPGLPRGNRSPNAAGAR